MSDSPSLLLQSLLDRCIEVGECLEWQGSISAGGSPRVWHQGRGQSTRKLMLQLVGRPHEPASGTKLVATCGNRRCVAPDHLRIITLAEHARKRMVPNTNHLLRAAKIARTRRERHARLTDSDVRAIRASDERAEDLAQRYGVSAKYIAHIRQGRRWRDHTVSPWAGMGAR